MTESMQLIQFTFVLISAFSISIVVISMLMTTHILFNRVKILEQCLMKTLIILQDNVEFNEKVKEIIEQSGLVNIVKD
jgi:hypothetical protein